MEAGSLVSVAISSGSERASTMEQLRDRQLHDLDRERIEPQHQAEQARDRERQRAEQARLRQQAEEATIPEVGPERRVSIAQRFAQVFGAVYLLIGILGFVAVFPILTEAPLVGNVAIEGTPWGPFSGFLIALFAVNWFHNLAHLAIGVAGLLVYRNPAWASTYALVIGAAYLLLFVLGLLGGPFGPLAVILPLNVIDNILHIVTALIAFRAYFASRGVPSPAR